MFVVLYWIRRRKDLRFSKKLLVHTFQKFLNVIVKTISLCQKKTYLIYFR